MGGSRHSLYPSVVCVDQKAEAFDRSESIISNQSDFIKSNNDDVIEDNNEDYESETSRLIPLADLKNELDDRRGIQIRDAMYDQLASLFDLDRSG